MCVKQRGSSREYQTSADGRGASSLARSLSLTHDMSGPCDTRSVRFLNRSKAGGEDETDRAVARIAKDEVRSGVRALAASGAEPGGSGGDLRGDGADLPALVSAV